MLSALERKGADHFMFSFLHKDVLPNFKGRLFTLDD